MLRVSARVQVRVRVKVRVGFIVRVSFRARVGLGAKFRIMGSIALGLGLRLGLGHPGSVHLCCLGLPSLPVQGSPSLPPSFCGVLGGCAGCFPPIPCRASQQPPGDCSPTGPVSPGVLAGVGHPQPCGSMPWQQPQKAPVGAAGLCQQRLHGDAGTGAARSVPGVLPLPWH